MAYSNQLPLSAKKIARCRAVAKAIGGEVAKIVRAHSTVGIERAVLRLIGFNGALERDALLYPSSNYLVDQLKAANRLGEGALYWVANALAQNKSDVPTLERALVEGKLNLGEIEAAPEARVRKIADELARRSFERLVKFRAQRKKMRSKLQDPAHEKRPLKYVIVATGNIFEDVTQAKAAVTDGADVIAVIRSTAQSLIDYVPQGNTTEGFGGTYATQANFNLMRQALDEIGRKAGKYIRLTNYCSGLCMSEIAALAAIEGLDCLLNDAMYGILFRDINMRRTLIDQHFSRLICGVSDIVIMTGEDNYMKTADAVKIGDQVLASQFINERAALNAGMTPAQMALGHAMEMDPAYDQVILLEIARAQMTRQIFPDSPLKYMCNTKYKTGDIFTSHAIDTIFNLIGSFTNQGYLLLGMPTEAVHTPFLQDRSLSIRDANYVLNGSLDMAREFGFRSDGVIAKFAEGVLDDALKLLLKIEKVGILGAIERTYFANVRRTVDGGKGANGVFAIDRARYVNPFFDLMGSKI